MSDNTHLQLCDSINKGAAPVNPSKSVYFANEAFLQISSFACQNVHYLNLLIYTLFLGNPCVQTIEKLLVLYQNKSREEIGFAHIMFK